jgi:hypothetical protein
MDKMILQQVLASTPQAQHRKHIMKVVTARSETLQGGSSSSVPTTPSSSSVTQNPLQEKEENDKDGDFMRSSSPPNHHHHGKEEVNDCNNNTEPDSPPPPDSLNLRSQSSQISFNDAVTTIIPPLANAPPIVIKASAVPTATLSSFQLFSDATRARAKSKRFSRFVVCYCC